MLTSGFVLLFGGKSALCYGITTGLASFVIYNGQRLIKATRNNETPWLNWVRLNYRMLIALTFFAAAVALYFLSTLWTGKLLATSALVAATLVSVAYLFPLKGIHLRKWPHLKIHLISISWVLVLLLFPALNEGFSVEALLFAATHYLYVLAVTIPFDIRDLKYDDRSMKTLPMWLGVRKSKILAVILLLIFGLLCMIQIPTLNRSPLFFLALILQFLWIAGMNERRGDWYCAGLIDGSIAVLGISYFCHAM